MSTDLHKLYYDDESYNMGHGHAYEHLGINPVKGAIVIVRPDQCKNNHTLQDIKLIIFEIDVSAVMDLADYQQTGKFFAGFLKCQT